MDNSLGFNLIKALLAYTGILWLFAGGYVFYLSRKYKRKGKK